MVDQPSDDVTVKPSAQDELSRLIALTRHNSELLNECRESSQVRYEAMNSRMQDQQDQLGNIQARLTQMVADEQKYRAARRPLSDVPKEEVLQVLSGAHADLMNAIASSMEEARHTTERFHEELLTALSDRGRNSSIAPPELDYIEPS
ncbi:uncharacterized protein FIBRA_03226 [Fibroporia radiculosa]|uniref:Uncharacterized protein n=1 Tax=Fibroporia radiculosa TaxID=599839 RepID=J4G4M8_9APHY|nr:uncharacterized protein FIBRA_03226 [Fibroporia radiculosa]CCM01178.1 predicted protein [Fibroporia radiculosa]